MYVLVNHVVPTNNGGCQQGQHQGRQLPQVQRSSPRVALHRMPQRPQRHLQGVLDGRHVSTGL
jgi:hypothetical protein